MKRSIISILSFILLAKVGFAYSLFNTRGLGMYYPPAEFQKIFSRAKTRMDVGFVLEYNYATNNTAVRDMLMFRPQRITFFTPLPWKFGLSLNICERYNLDFSVRSDSTSSGDYTLIRAITGRGGVAGFRVALDKTIFNIIYLGGGYERYFGGAWERWDSEIIELKEKTVDSLLYHFRGNGAWAMAGVNIGTFQLRGFYNHSFDLNIDTEVQTSRDTSLLDSASYQPPAEFGGILTYRARDYSLGLSYIQQTGGNAGRLEFVPGRIVELGGGYKFDNFSINAKAGWHQWYVRTNDNQAISDIYLGFGTRIPLKQYGVALLNLTGGYRTGGELSEYHAELNLGIEFNELWKKRERKWGG